MRFVLPSTYARSRMYRLPKGPVPPPVSCAVDLTEVQIPTDDGLWLNGWLVQPRNRGHDQPPFVVYFPGIQGHRGHRLQEVEMFAHLGCDLLLVDYRGYADNEGQPGDPSLAADARAIWRFVRNELDVPAERIMIFGESLGSAVGTRLVADLSRIGVVPGGLVLRSPFASMVAVVSQYDPWILVKVFLCDCYPTIRRIRRVDCPLLVIHGAEDRTVPIAMGRRVYAAASTMSKNGVRKRFLELPGIGHGNILKDAGEVLESALEDFLQSAKTLPHRKILPSRVRSPAMRVL